MNGVPLRTAARLVAVLAAVGVAREGYFHLVSEPAWRLPETWREGRPEARYLAVRSVLPAVGRVGYLTDVPVSTRPGALDSDEFGTWLYQQAQYALAPLVLVYGDATTEVVLANFKDAGRVDALAREYGLRVAERFHGGSVVVLRR